MPEPTAPAFTPALTPALKPALTPTPANPAQGAAAPVGPIATPVPPAGLNCRRIDVAKLVAEINSDLIRLNNDLVAAQANSGAAHEAYSALVEASDRAYNDLLARQERERAVAFAASAKSVAEAQARWQAAAAKQKAAEDEIGSEIKYVVGLVGGDPSATTPTLREAPGA